MSDLSNPVIASAQATSFPQKISISITLEFEVSDQDQLDYFLAIDKTANIEFVADLFDFLEQFPGETIFINKLTYDDVRKALNEKSVPRPATGNKR